MACVKFKISIHCVLFASLSVWYSAHRLFNAGALMKFHKIKPQLVIFSAGKYVAFIGALMPREMGNELMKLKLEIIIGHRLMSWSCEIERIVKC